MTTQSSFLATRRGKLTLALLCAVGFLDFIDASIVNIALPSIRRDLHFSVQGLQWGLGGRRLPRRRADPGAWLAVGAVRQPARLPAPARRDLRHDPR
jgi:MFS family permease